MVAAHIASYSNAISSVILSWVWQSLLLGTFFAGLTYLLIRLLRLRMGSTLEAGLWLIVLVKFLVPIGPSWTFSLSSVCFQLFQSSPVHNIPSIDPIAHDIENFYPADVDSRDYGMPSAILPIPVHSPLAEDVTSPQWHGLSADVVLDVDVIDPIGVPVDEGLPVDAGRVEMTRVESDAYLW